ncbi:hypothetical protein [Sphingomonas sp. Mn802worker]|uniref:hypothetical protein n=1 Tax=Sphingomonas sp. Mn802worker TaxID=629773 RepID=UPI000368F192|nr:hypothetical protein [Sphingomonas sp. Mn802worker]
MFRWSPALLGVAVLTTATLASTFSAAATPRVSPDAELQDMLKGYVAGKPVECISLPNVTGNTIVTGRAIVYQLGTRLFVNVPPDGASRLHRDDIIVTRTFGSNLCRQDLVRLLDRTSTIPHGFVALGRFVPYTKSKVN